MENYNIEVFANRCAGRRGVVYTKRIVNHGRRRSVRLGQFTDGASPEYLVAKTPKRGWLDSAQNLCVEVPIADAEAALPLLAAFHQYIDMHFPEVSDQVLVKLNVPTIWRHNLAPAENSRTSSRAGQGKTPLTREVKMLVEPFVENLQYFNTNTGWALEEAELMQALSHFSYHRSGGKQLLCDLQGAWLDAEECYGAEHNYVLTNVSLMTSSWGATARNAAGSNPSSTTTDLGDEGIENFFSLHQCNGFCSSGWRTWKNALQHFDPSETSKIRADLS